MRLLMHCEMKISLAFAREEQPELAPILPSWHTYNTAEAAPIPDTNCFSGCILLASVKSCLFITPTSCQIIGLVILCIGIYAEVERQKHRTLEGIFLAPAVVLLLLGITMFAVSFIGMVGSLRDNRTLLKMFFWVLLVIFITEMLLIFIEIIFENKMNAVFHSNIQEGIRHYYDDLDFKNILDFVQERVPGEVINTLCGYKTLEKERLQLVDIIHVRGCIHAVGLWFKDNFEVTFGIVCTLLLPQVLGLVMARLYWRKLDDIYCRWDTVDFKALEVINFKAVDLTGAGWCLCFPREGGYIPVNVTDDDDDEVVIGQSKV
ncbi:tetraspanin-15-like isoform X5 [Mauremys reevesii]|uniref:tetraspanin-15-like isoform X5 n=1 Tax=Mauremys reevesii TaxID=260615 RepID=UPI00193FE3EE|nr:tetraspanin-15-like isoform X5 [Mauremys reevesii]